MPMPRHSHFKEISDIIETRPLNDRQTLLYFQPHFNLRFFYLFLTFSALITASIIFYTGYLIFAPNKLNTQYDKNSLAKEELPIERGLIYSSDHQILADNEPAYIVYLDKADADTLSNRADFITQVSALIESDPEIIADKLDELASKPRAVIKEIPRSQAIELLPRITAHPEIPLKILTTFKRAYITDYEFAPIIGYVKRDGLSYNGVMGIEKLYDAFLDGSPGYKQFEKDTHGSPRKQIISQAPLSPQPLTLTIDSRLQKKLYAITASVLAERGLKNSAAIVSNPATGEIISAVSIPSYNQNKLSFVLSKSALSKLLTSESLFNRAFSGLYSPGSIFKLFVGLGAITEHAVDPNKKIKTPYALTLPSRYYKGQGFTFHDWKDHKELTFTEAIANSSNSYFFKLGSGFFPDVPGLGIEKMMRYASETFFSRIIGDQIPDEKPGSMPDPAIMKAGDVMNASIGQGTVSVSLLQLNTLTNSIANQGFYYSPHLVQQSTPPTPITTPFSPDAFRLVKEGMCMAVDQGTARRIGEVAPQACAKTGTSQIGGKITNALFTVFYPRENPRISITVIVEAGGEGSDTALTIAKNFLQYYLTLPHETVSNQKADPSRAVFRSP